MNLDRKSQQQLIRETEELATNAKNNMRLGDSYVIRSNAKLIESNARVEGEIGNLINKLQEFNHESSAQTKELISLTKSIKGLSFEASTQTQTLIKLTKRIVILTVGLVILTVVLVVGLIVQLATAR